jgi:hypothetical protein
MSLFHIANDGNIVSMISMATDFVVEMNIDDIPDEAKAELKKIFDTHTLILPKWTKTGVFLDHSSPLYLWFLYEKAERTRTKEEEPAVTLAMAMYADYAYREHHFHITEGQEEQ